jgi:hypothetical protein
MDFNSKNTTQYKRNQMLKAELKNLDFGRVAELITSLFEIQNGNLIFTNNNSIDEILNSLFDNDCHISGRGMHIKSEIFRENNKAFEELNSENLNFNVIVALQDDTMVYNLKFRSIGKELFENLNKFYKSEKIYITYLKFNLEFDNGSYNPFFTHTVDTKVYVKGPNVLDKTLSPLFNKQVQEVLDNTLKEENEKRQLESGRKNCVTSFRINNFQSLLDITKRNEGEYIDIINSTEINESLNKIPPKVKDFADLLVKPVEFSIYGMTNAININLAAEIRDVCGMIKSVKNDEKIKMVELLSLKDSNSIKMLIYKANTKIDLKENMVIFVKSIPCKINKNFDIILENPHDGSIKILGMLSAEESNKLRKFRYDRNKEVDCLIDLTQPILVRGIQKVYNKLT